MSYFNFNGNESHGSVWNSTNYLQMSSGPKPGPELGPAISQYESASSISYTKPIGHFEAQPSHHSDIKAAMGSMIRVFSNPNGQQAASVECFWLLRCSPFSLLKHHGLNESGFSCYHWGWCSCGRRPEPSSTSTC